MSVDMVQSLDIPDEFSLILLDFKLIVCLYFDSIMLNVRWLVSASTWNVTQNTAHNVNTETALSLIVKPLAFKLKPQNSSEKGQILKGHEQRIQLLAFLFEYKFLEQNSFQTKTIITCFLIFLWLTTWMHGMIIYWLFLDLIFIGIFWHFWT